MRLTFIALLFTIPIYLTSKPSKSEMAKIEYLLNTMEKSTLTFIRNGSSYSGKKAASHFRDKLDYADDELETVEQFITHIATKSSMSGKYYLVVLKSNKKVRLANWLREQLKNYK